MKTDNPYIGPRSFTRDQRDRFFGRSREARNLLSLVISERLVLFYAQSGAGKTSLLNTSLIPSLEDNGRAVLPKGRVSGQLPAGVDAVDNIFIFNLLTHLDQSNTDPACFTHMELKDFLDHLSSTDGESYFYDPAEVEGEEPADDDEALIYVLVIDQFEEILTDHPERWQDRADFFRQLDQAMRHDPGLFVVLTLREDYVAALDPYASLLTERMQSRFYMERMGRKAALEAVTKPAKDYGRPFAPGAAEILVDNLSLVRSAHSGELQPGQYIEPVQLQVVCYQLWRNLPPLLEEGKNEITEEQVNTIGNINQSLANFYEQALAETIRETKVSELELRNWFKEELITGAGTRGTVFQDKDSTKGMDNRVVRLLENRFLLRAESRSGAVWYELIHDRFVEPILQANREWLEEQGALLRDALAWQESGGKEKSLLYTGKKLDRTLAEIEGEGLPESVAREFLAACKAEQAAVKEKQRRRNKTIITLTAGLLVAVALSVFSFVQWRNAKENAVKAKRNAEQAEQQTLAANYNLAKAFEEKALSALDTVRKKNDVGAYKEALLFASATLEQKIAEDKSALKPNSMDRLFVPEVFYLALAEQWTSPAGKNHQQAVEDAAFSPDGKHIVSASADKTLRLWDVGTGKETAVFKGHADRVSSAAYSPDGKHIVSASWDKTLRLWDVETGKEIAVFKGHEDGVHSVAFSPNRKRIVSASWDKTLRLWDVETGKEIAVFKGHEDGVHSVAFSPNGKRIVSASKDKTLRLWDVGTGKETAVFKGHEDGVYSAMFSPDGKRIVSASADKTLRLWDVGTGKETAVFKGHEDPVISATFSPDGKHIISASWDKTIRLWDVETGKESTVFKGHEDLVWSAAFSPDGKRIVSTSYDKTIRLWGVGTGKGTAVFKGHEDRVFSVAFSPDGKRVRSAAG